MTEAGGVENAAVRAAIEAFAATPGKAADGGSLDVLRHCLHGNLLLDITGSDLRISEDGTSLSAGSTIRIATTSDPDGGTALVAFTGQAEIARTRSAAAQTQSMVRSGIEVLELVRSQDHQWLYLDPAGPTCAISRAEVEFALQLARNDPLRDALDVVAENPERREALLDALRADGTLLVAADAEGALLVAAEAGGGLQVFTSGPEAAVHAPGASILPLSSAQVRELLRSATYSGLVINPAGPTATVSASEVLGQQ